MLRIISFVNLCVFLLEREAFLYLFHIIKLFPCEEFHSYFLRFVIERFVLFSNGLRFATHVSVCRRFLIDGITQFESLLDGIGGEREDALYLFGYLAICHVDVTLSVGIDEDADGFCHADGITELYQHFVCHTGCYHVLCYVSCCIGCRAVHFRGVFSAECTTAVCAFAAVGVDNDFASGETCIAMWSADDELSGRVDVVFYFFVEEGVDSF